MLTSKNRQCILDMLGNTNPRPLPFHKVNYHRAIITNGKSLRIETHFSNIEITLYPNQIKLTSQTLAAKNMDRAPLSLHKVPRAFLQASHQAHGVLTSGCGPSLVCADGQAMLHLVFLFVFIVLWTLSFSAFFLASKSLVHQQALVF